MSVTSIIHSPTERDFDSFRYNITANHPNYRNRFSQNPIILYMEVHNGYVVVFTMQYSLASQKERF
jgi:hypothetical protein